MGVADMLKAKAAKLRAEKSSSKPTTTAKSELHRSTKKATAKKSSAKKTERVSTRVQIKDKKGKAVTGRDNTFVCVECGHEITGPWSYKNHLVNQHKYSRSKAGLRPESK